MLSVTIIKQNKTENMLSLRHIDPLSPNTVKYDDAQLSFYRDKTNSIARLAHEVEIILYVSLLQT